ncbi:Homoserine dehydrogenase [Candidatus Magnetoovum chiemensis]|nr:Homoserine dehydrogenase [Candidatus Magnetoovum chiemensis]
MFHKIMINVGIIGFGTVGSGTAKILVNNKDHIREKTGIDINLKKIADLDIEKDRGISLPKGVLTKDVKEILNDPQIDIVVETMGGITPAKNFIIEALNNKKHVVTANKALLAQHGNELFGKANDLDLCLGFEASVAGGIPIIKVLREGLAANKITDIYGIINGTSNYILSKMTKQGSNFSEALKEAQKLGFAEADPSFDIQGIDAAHKLTIMASLCFGIPLSYDKVYKEGIENITAQDIEFAKALGYKIKLLAIAKAANNELELRVHPTMVPEYYLLSKVDDVFNAIYAVGDYVGPTLYYGSGAGQLPTGSAVVADIIDIAKNKQRQSKNLQLNMGNNDYKIKDMKDIESMYYFKFSALDKPNVLSQISGALGAHNISISAVMQKGRKVGESVPVVVLTHRAKENNVLDALSQIDRLNVVTDKTKYIRVEGKDIY